MLAPMNNIQAFGNPSSHGSTWAECTGAQGHIFCVVCRRFQNCYKVAMPYVFRYLANELAALNIKLTLGVRVAS